MESWITQNCIVCRKEFRFHKSRFGRAKYCSMTCRNKDYLHRHLFKGERNGKWQLKPTYNAIHLWLKDRYGKATLCEQCGSNNRVQWALLKGKEYERKRENFWMLCASCHMEYDGTSVGRFKGQKLSKEHIEKIRLFHLGRKWPYKPRPSMKGRIPWNKGLKMKEVL